MGQEIERARSLLAGLVREGVLPADRANAAYEAWVAQPGDEVPFALFLVREGRAEPARVRGLLRLAAVQGMPHPERFTAERFEDLLMGQLGVEAGLLSSKLLQTVRGVQDKKVEEGKLRRLDDLLPRAGFDPVQLRILREHLAEHVLICPGCLARFPRRDRLRVEHGCPRCGDRITAAAIGESDLKLAPELKRKQEELLTSSNENSAVFETLTVAARERGSRAPAPTKGPSPGLVVVGVGSLLAVGALAVWGLSPRPKAPIRLQPRPTATTTTSTEAASVGPAPDGKAPRVDERPPTFTEARALDRRWAAEGRWTELVAMWRRVEPGPGEAAADVRAAKAERVAELERRAAHAAEATRLLESARAAGSFDEERERALVLALEGAPSEAAPYDELARELRERRARRRADVREAARERLAAARATGSTAAFADPWGARLEQARRLPLAAVEIGGRVADGVVVERLDQDGFAVRMADGDVRTFSWTQDPALALLVMQRAARADAREDRLEVLRRALLARDLAVARMALSDLGAPKDALDAEAVVATAATSAPPIAVAGGWRLRWSTRAAGHDLVTRHGTLGTDRGGLALTGEPCELATPTLEVAAGSDGAIDVTLRVETDAREPFAAVDLIGLRGRRSYVVRWDAQGWRLEVDLGAGANVLKQGTLPAQAQAARLRVGQTELVLLLDGIERATTPIAARHEALVVRAGAAAGPVIVTELTVEGALSSEWIARSTVDLAAEVEGRLDELSQRLAAEGPAELPVLSVEDAQGLARASAATLDLLAAARRALTSGDPERAKSVLDEAEAQTPGLLAVLHLRALAALLLGDLDAAHRRLALALERDETFSEARALLALVHARAGRRDAARASAATAIEQRADLAHAHLALARTAWLTRLTERALSAELVTGPLNVARALSPGDPLVQAEARALQRALKLEAASPTWAAEAPHAVMGPAGAEKGAADLLKTLGALSLRYERSLRRTGPAAPLVAVLVPAQAPASLLARDTAAAWDPALGVVLVREGTSLGWDLAHAVARAFVAGAYGSPPPWLESGLTTTLAAPAAAEDPPGFKEVLGSAPVWDADGWRGLFGMELEPLRNNTLARAKAWALINYAQRQAPTWRVIAQLLERLSKGEPVAWPADAPIDLGALDAQLGTGFKRR